MTVRLRRTQQEDIASLGVSHLVIFSQSETRPMNGLDQPRVGSSGMLRHSGIG